MKFELLLLIFIFILSSCKEKGTPIKEHLKWSTDQSTQLNENFAREDEIEIRLFLNHKKYTAFQQTGTGLRYWIYDDKEGQNAKENDIVEIKFEMRLLNDSLLYKTEGNETRSFKIDKTDIESGIMEGVKLMSEGDKAKFILPSHIGHGLLGDFDKIPPLEVLFIDLELIKIR